MNRAEADWRAFRLKIYGSKPLSKMQERECSLSFYAGMMACFNACADIAAAAVDDEAGGDELEVLKRQIAAAAARTNLNRNDSQS
jgi:hypothetical protein